MLILWDLNFLRRRCCSVLQPVWTRVDVSVLERHTLSMWRQKNAIFGFDSFYVSVIAGNLLISRVTDRFLRKSIEFFIELSLMSWSGPVHILKENLFHLSEGILSVYFVSYCSRFHSAWTEVLSSLRLISIPSLPLFLLDGPKHSFNLLNSVQLLENQSASGVTVISNDPTNWGASEGKASRRHNYHNNGVTSRTLLAWAGWQKRHKYHISVSWWPFQAERELQTEQGREGEALVARFR